MTTTDAATTNTMSGRRNWHINLEVSLKVRIVRKGREMNHHHQNRNKRIKQISKS